jgi:hypothetical protein
MSKQSMPGDKTGWKRGAGTYSRSYANLNQKGNPDSTVNREADVDRGSTNGGYAGPLPKGKKNRDGSVY